METTKLKGNGEVRAGRTELDVPHLGRNLTFVLPFVGPNYHKDVMDGIDKQKLLRPTTAQTFSLIDVALQNAEEPHCAEILNRFRGDYLWTSTESISFPEGVVVYDNIHGTMPKSSLDLMKLVEAGDPKARFVPKGFKTGDMPISDFLKNPYTIAQVGEDMLPVVERVAKQVNDRIAWVYGLNNSESDTKRYAAVGGYFAWLDLYGLCHGDDGDGCASGVLDTGEASRVKDKE